MVEGYYARWKRLLLEHGCRCVRPGKGDHEIWHSPISGRNFTLDASCRSRHTANAVLKQAGIAHKF